MGSDGFGASYGGATTGLPSFFWLMLGGGDDTGEISGSATSKY
jgi:hypothetical protein